MVARSLREPDRRVIGCPISCVVLLRFAMVGLLSEIIPTVGHYLEIVA